MTRCYRDILHEGELCIGEAAYEVWVDWDFTVMRLCNDCVTELRRKDGTSILRIRTLTPRSRPAE